MTLSSLRFLALMLILPQFPKELAAVVPEVPVKALCEAKPGLSAYGAAMQGNPEKPLSNRSPSEVVRLSSAQGVLRIEASGAKLGEILTTLHNSTGTDISGATPSDDPVFASLCGPADEVVADLLNGSDLQYVIVMSHVHRGEIGQIILTPREALKSPLAALEGSRLRQSPELHRNDSGSEANRLRYGIETTPTIGAAPDPRLVIAEPATDTNESSKATQVTSGPPQVTPSAVTDGTTPQATEKQSTEKAISPSGQYMQEMYRLRQQMPPESGPVPH